MSYAGVPGIGSRETRRKRHARYECAGGVGGGGGGGGGGWQKRLVDQRGLPGRIRTATKRSGGTVRSTGKSIEDRRVFPYRKSHKGGHCKIHEVESESGKDESEGRTRAMKGRGANINAAEPRAVWPKKKK